MYVPVVYFIVLQRFAKKCINTRAAIVIVQLIKPFALRSVRCWCGLCKVSDVVVYQKSRCRPISVLLESVFKFKPLSHCWLKLKVQSWEAKWDGMKKENATQSISTA